MQEEPISIKAAMIESTRTALASGPEETGIAALIKQDASIIGVVTLLEITRPEMGTSAGSWGIKAEYDDGRGRRIHDLFLRFESTGETIFKYTNLATQYRIMRALGKSEVPVPVTLCLDPDGSTLGTPGFIMERIEGDVPSDYYQSGLVKEATPEARRTMVLGVARVQAKLHSLDWQSLNLDFLIPAGGTNFIESELTRCWKEISWAAPEILDDAEPTYRWLMDNQPAKPDIAFCHGDSNLTNYMYRDNQVVGVLDWEFAFLGPGEFDLAYFLAVTDTWTNGLVPPEGYPTPQEIKTEYERARGCQLRDWEYACKRAYFTVACNLWMGLRFCPPEGLEDLKLVTDYCNDRASGRQAIGF